jgi:hypothetical protein
MKRYKLLKDLPFAKAGVMVEMWSNGTMAFVNNPALPRFNKKDVRMFSLWFEEVKELKLPKEFFYIIGGKISNVDYLTFSFDEEDRQKYKDIIEEEKSVGNYFETREEAEEYLEFLKAKEVIKQDNKGFKPNWNDTKQIKYSCSYDEDRFTGYGCVKPVIDETSTKMGALIYFKSKEDIEESLKKHPEEWRKYLFYEQ